MLSALKMTASLPDAELPAWLEEIVSRLPRSMSRRRGGQEVSQHLFDVSHRTLEAWPLSVRRVNGHAILDTRELFALAYRKYLDAPVVMGGRRTGGEVHVKTLPDAEFRSPETA